ncbi:DUF397 domain-containing protein [Streptomyces sp. NPDC052701]|uniref:DUF397 domain-containing protein n=1 Tax=Streptomyces sp. NPDC052701 TaxID=3155533 RepID=UPI00343F7BC0
MSIIEVRSPGDPVWFTSSYSNGAGGECVECAATDDGALVRDSKHARGAVIPVGAHAWRCFVRAVSHFQRTDAV